MENTAVSEDQVAKPRPAQSFTLEDWEIVSFSDPTGALKLCLVGHAYGNSLPLSGANVRTTAIARYHLDESCLVITTRSGSEYKLGMRNSSEEQAQLRLTRYLDRFSLSDRKDLIQSTSNTTSILGTQGGAEHGTAKK
jgi:hypothetical protein